MVEGQKKSRGQRKPAVVYEPIELAVPETVWELKATETEEPTGALPETGIGIPDCNTIFEATNGCTESAIGCAVALESRSAERTAAKARQDARRTMAIELRIPRATQSYRETAEKWVQKLFPEKQQGEAKSEPSLKLSGRFSLATRKLTGHSDLNSRINIAVRYVSGTFYIKSHACRLQLAKIFAASTGSACRLSVGKQLFRTSLAVSFSFRDCSSGFHFPRPR